MSNKGKVIILYEDNHLLVVEKPVNVPTQEDSTGDPDMLTMLKEDIKARYNKPGNVYLGLVHRLDRPVGGVMVFARTSKSASRLSEQIRQRAFGKIYLAVVHGKPEDKKGTLRHFLVKDTVTNTVKVVGRDIKGAKEAVLDYEMLGFADLLSLCRINLHTGRPHQIRVQLAAVGSPLYGDRKYGPETGNPGGQIALWAAEIRFVHPTTGEELCFRSEPPRNHYPWKLFFQV